MVTATAHDGVDLAAFFECVNRFAVPSPRKPLKPGKRAYTVTVNPESHDAFQDALDRLSGQGSIAHQGSRPAPRLTVEGRPLFRYSEFAQ